MRQILSVFALCAVLGGLSAPAAASCDDALQFVRGVGQQVTDTVANTSYTADQRLEQFRQIFHNNADFATMGKVALGRYWNKLPQSRWSEYFGLVEKMIVRTMLAQLNDYAGEHYSIETTTCSLRGGRENQFLVDGPVIKEGGGKVTDVRWWVIEKSNGELKVLDIMIAGISLALQKRDEFDYFITDNGRRVEALLDDLRAKYGS